jgi:hypothetical protein
MTFIRNYNGAMQILAEIGTGSCKGSCKTVWMRNIKYAVKSKTNPLQLTKSQRKSMTAKINNLSSKRPIAKTLKKYINRKSPPYPANENCNKRMIGNDGNMYISRPNKNNVCSWIKE